MEIDTHMIFNVGLLPLSEQVGDVVKRALRESS
jgi:hypothetical protein